MLCVFFLLSYSDPKVKVPAPSRSITASGQMAPSLIVLGTLQDAGSPQIACQKECCGSLFSDPDPRRKVVSLGLIDPAYKKTFLFEATPDIGEQLKIPKKYQMVYLSPTLILAIIRV